MDIRLSTFQAEVAAVIASGEKPVHFYWECSILVNGVSHKALKTFTIDIEQDFSQNYGDNIVVRAMFPLSVYVKQILPNRDNMTATLYRRPYSESGRVLPGSPVEAQIYRALPIESNDPLMSPQLQYADDDASLDVGNPVTLHFQLVERALESIRLASWGGIPQRIAPGSVLRAVYTDLSKKLKIDGSQLIAGVQMVEPDNQTPRNVVMVPHGTPVTELPDLLQNDQGGIYNAGIDHYLQNGYWYIWPRYGVNRYNKAKRTLTVYDLPENAWPNIERTFREDPYQVVIVATGESKNFNQTEGLNLNKGNGVRYARADKIIGGNITVENGKVVARRGVGNNEFVTEQRRTGLNFAPFAKERISGNDFKEASRLAATKGIFVMTTWENAEPGILEPGMPTRYLYLKDGQVQERRGVLSKAHFYIQPDNQVGITFAQHNCNAVLALFLDKELYDPANG